MLNSEGYTEKIHFYHSRFSDYCLHLYYHIHNVSVDVSTGILRVFLVKLRTLHVLYLIHGVTFSDSVNNNRVLVLNIPVLLLACSQGRTRNIHIIVSLEASGTNTHNHYAMCSAGHRDPLGLNKRRSLKFRAWQGTPKEGPRKYRPQRCEYYNTDEDNSLKTLNDKNVSFMCRLLSLYWITWRMLCSSYSDN